MDKKEGFKIIIGAFRQHLETIRKQHPKNLLKLELKDVEISEKEYSDYLTFNIIAQYNYNLPNQEVISYVVDEIYKFSNYEKLFGLNKGVHFFYIFTTE
jgi:hypothetical protein